MMIQRLPYWAISIVASGLALGELMIPFTSPAWAQRRPVADTTLGTEQSIVTPDVFIHRISGDVMEGDRISGGAQRGSNLFHSFQDFDIDDGRAAYFENPLGVETILTRVTGNSRSDILGTLGVLGDADLFLLNPNGILFGPNANLDLRGSFLATTADAIQFEDQGFFSTSNSNISQILTIDPSAILFNQFTQPRPINAQGSSLRVLDNQTLMLLGGNIILNDSFLRAGSFDGDLGRIEITALSGTGAVGLNYDSNGFRPRISPNLPLGDITITNGSILSISGRNDGGIGINARNFTLSDVSVLRANINGDDNANGSNRDINIRVRETTQVSGESTISNDNYGSANGGQIIINTGSLFIVDNADITTSTLEQGDAGDLIVNAADRVEVIGGSDRSSLSSDSERFATGSAGDVRIATQQLVARNGGQIGAGTFGAGNSGNLTIIATEGVEVVGRSPANPNNNIDVSDDGSLPSLLSTQVNRPPEIEQDEDQGDGGNIYIETQRLRIGAGAAIAARTFGIGQSNAGNITVIASDSVEIDGAYKYIINNEEQIRRSSIVTQSGRRVGGDTRTGNAGNISIDTTRLTITDEATLNSRNSVRGDAGDITITASLIELNRNGILSSEMFGTRSLGNAGNLIVRAEQVNVQNNSQITASTITSGSQGGNIRLYVSERLALSNNSTLIAQTENGQGGNLAINAGELATDSIRLRSNSRISTEATSTGFAGNLLIQADRLQIEDFGSTISATAQSNVGGNIRIHSRLVDIEGDARISASTESGRGGNIWLRGIDVLQVQDGEISASATTGRAGNLRIITTNGEVLLTGIQENGRPSGLSVEATEQGEAGSLILSAEQVKVTEGAAITVSSRIGQAGNLTIAANQIQLDQGTLTAETRGVGGDIGASISLNQVSLLFLQNNSLISARANGNATGGNVSIDNANGFIVALPDDNNNIIASALRGRGGNIEITTQGLFGIEERRSEFDNQTNSIDASSQFGIQGNVTVTTPDVDPGEGLVELPTNFVDAANQIAQRCPVRTSPTGPNSEFVVTGRGGLPPNVSESLSSDVVPVDLVTLDRTPSATQPSQLEASDTTPPSFIEAEGWVRQDGQVRLIADASALRSLSGASTNCPPS